MDRNVPVETSSQVVAPREPSSPIAELVKKSDSESGGASLFSQLTSNPFFTAVSSCDQVIESN